MGQETAAANLVSEETVDLPPSSPASVELPDEVLPMADTALTTAQSSEPVSTPCGGLSREQVTAGLQPHIAAAENRVSRALQQVVGSIETRLLVALRQAAIDIIENLGKEAAACLVISERKAALLSQQLNNSKQEALAMLMRLKQVSDCQICDAEKKILIERRRAQEAETKLYSAQESNKRLKAEVKRRGQQLEEFQRRNYPSETEQGTQMGLSEGSDSRRRASRLKGAVGEKYPQQTGSTSVDLVNPPMSQGFPALRRLENSVMEVQSANVSMHPPFDSLAGLGAYTAIRIQMEMPGVKAYAPEHVTLQVKDGLLLKSDCHVTEEEPNVPQENGSPLPECASLRGTEQTSVTLYQPPSMIENLHRSFLWVEGSPSSKEHGQHLLSSQNVDWGLKSTKDSDKDKSCLTIGAHHCNDESLPANKSQFNANLVGMELQTSARAECEIAGGKFHGHEVDASVECTEQLEANEGPREVLPIQPESPKMSKVQYDRTRSHFWQSATVSHPIEEGLGTQDVSPEVESFCQECDEDQVSVETTVGDEQAVLKSTVASPVLAELNSDLLLPSHSLVKAVSNHIGRNLQREDPYWPETPDESPENQVPRRKRKQGVLISKYDYSVKNRNSKRLDEESVVPGALDLLTTAGVDAHISSRDNRRLMQGARQLFSLAERKWR